MGLTRQEENLLETYNIQLPAKLKAQHSIGWMRPRAGDPYQTQRWDELEKEITDMRKQIGILIRKKSNMGNF